MKALIISLCLLLSVLIIIFFGLHYLQTNTTYVLNILNQVRNQYINNNIDESLKTLDDLIQKYDSIRPTLSVLINHNEISKVEISLLKLKAFLQKNDDVMFESEYNSLVFMVNNINSSEMLNLANLF